LRTTSAPVVGGSWWIDFGACDELFCEAVQQIITNHLKLFLPPDVLSRFKLTQKYFYCRRACLLISKRQMIGK
jgi:hypothetical protein